MRSSNPRTTLSFKVLSVVVAAYMMCDYARLKYLGTANVRQELRLAWQAPTGVCDCPQLHDGSATTLSAGPSAAAVLPSPSLAACQWHALRMEPGVDNPLYKFYLNMKGKEVPHAHKWKQYFDVYQRYFQRFVGQEVHFLEIGVQSGGSLEMWKSYFGPGLHYYGVDINPYTKVLFDQPPNITIYIGSQTDKAFWAQVRASAPKFDIILDDGGHRMEHQITTFQEMYKHVKNDGVYMVEDCGTSYDPDYGGGHKANNSWIEFSKPLVDEGLNADYYKGRTGFTSSLMSIAYFDQMVVFEKGSHTAAVFPEGYGSVQMDYMPPTLADGSVDPKVVAQLKHLYKQPY